MDQTPSIHPASTAPAPIDRLRAIMRRLRDPAAGCAWDVAQSFATIAPYTIEEAYEVAEAIEKGDMAALREELGDLLLQSVYHAQMAEEIGAFTFDEVATGIADKLVRRHPHVFGDAEIRDAEQQVAAWEAQKAAERDAKAKSAGGAQEKAGVLDGVSVALPALTRAAKLQRRAARVGFDWDAAPPILDKIQEEIAELQAELAAGTVDRARVADELGDVLFACVNLARWLEVDPEAALRGTNAKFERRFRRIEALLAEDGLSPAEVDLDRMEALWTQAKQEERTP